MAERDYLDYSGLSRAVDKIKNLEKTYIGTTDDWDELSTDEKKQFKRAIFTDDVEDFGQIAAQIVAINDAIDTINGSITAINGNITTINSEITRLDGRIDNIPSIQVSTMPTASISELGKVYQYIGSTTSEFTHGYFYQCDEESGSYSWNQIIVQDSDAGMKTILQSAILFYETQSNLPSTSDIIITGQVAWIGMDNTFYRATNDGSGNITWTAYSNYHMAVGSDYMHGIASTSTINITSVGK